MDNIQFIYNKNNRFNIYVYASCGSIFENNKNSGISHVLEHMLLKHTKQYNENKLLKELTKVGADYNAVTEKDLTYYYCWSHMNNYKKVLDIISSVALNPIFHKNEFELEKLVVLQEINGDNSDKLLNKFSLLTILGKDNAYIKPIDGNINSINKLTIKDLKLYFTKHYKNLLIVINCDEKYSSKVKDYVYKKFGLPQKINFDRLSNVFKLNVLDFTKQIIVLKDDVSASKTYINFISFPQSMLKENTIVNFIRYILISSGLKSILLTELRSKRGLVYSIQSMNDIYRYIGLLRFRITTTTKNILRIFSIFFNIINKIKKKGILSLDYYKKSYLNHKRFDFTGDGYKTHWYGRNLFYGNTVLHTDLYKIINSITQEDIIQITNIVFNYDKIGILVNGNYNINVENDIKDLIDSYK